MILEEPSELADVLSDEGPVVLLESQSPGHPEGRMTYLAARPQQVFKGNREGNPWDTLSGLRRKAQDWMFGYLGYDLKNYLEDLQSGNPDPVGAPLYWFMVPGLLLRWDAGSGRPEVLKGSLPQRAALKRNPSARPGVSGLGPTIGREEYIGAVKEAQRRIREGEFYEVNLSHQLEGRFSGNSAALYREMKKVGPVPFGAYISLGDEGIEICSQSPERFLRKEGRVVFSQPIKGTIHRGLDAQEDRQLREALASSAKDRAENLMIVDLVRNDLGRIAVKNSVRVRTLFEIQSFGTVHQMVSTVEAEAAEDDPVEIIKACYPMGSMTGAPKISAMKAIEELENYRRGIYSGAIGYFTPQADFDFNVVIRTAIIKGNKLWYPVGGAITSDSDPGDEWNETLVKARALTQISND